MCWSLRLLALTALCVASYLAWISLQAGDAAVGCGGLPYFDCEHVLGSRWSSWLGVPVSLPAAIIYVVIFAASAAIGPGPPGSVQRLAWLLLLPLVMTAAGAAAWFIVILLLVVKKLCLYCLIVHTCGLTLAAIVLTTVLQRTSKSKEAWLAGLASRSGKTAAAQGDTVMPSVENVVSAAKMAVVVMVVLITAQLLFPGKKYRIEQLGDGPTIVGGQLHMEIANHPVLGRPDAPHMVVKLFDYTCRHCRVLHRHLEEARRRYGDRLVVVLIPVPINTDCNEFARSTHPDQENACEYTRAALAVWLFAPSEFESYHMWLFEEIRPPLVSTAQRRAAELIGRVSLDDVDVEEAVEQRLGQYTRLYDQCGGASVPKMLLGNRVVTGEGADAEEICELLERLLGVRSQAPP